MREQSIVRSFKAFGIWHDTADMHEDGTPATLKLEIFAVCSQLDLAVRVSLSQPVTAWREQATPISGTYSWISSTHAHVA